MTSQITQWYKDQRLIDALDRIRQSGQSFMSKCYFCGDKSIGIKSIEEKLFPVCEKHEDKKDINKLLETQSSFEE